MNFFDDSYEVIENAYNHGKSCGPHYGHFVKEHFFQDAQDVEIVFQQACYCPLMPLTLHTKLGCFRPNPRTHLWTGQLPFGQLHLGQLPWGQLPYRIITFIGKLLGITSPAPPSLTGNGASILWVVGILEMVDKRGRYP